MTNVCLQHPNSNYISAISFMQVNYCEPINYQWQEVLYSTTLSAKITRLWKPRADVAATDLFFHTIIQRFYIYSWESFFHSFHSIDYCLQESKVMSSTYIIPEEEKKKFYFKLVE